MTTYDLKAAIEQLVMDTDLPPREIAEKVAAGVPAKQLRAVLAEVLEQHVKFMLSRRRSTNALLSVERESAPAASASSSAPPVARVRSAKVTAIREAWRKALQDRIHVGPSPMDWKTLADCTHEDLMFAAEERRQHAERNLAKADQFQALAEKLTAHGVARVADLPTPVLADSLAA